MTDGRDPVNKIVRVQEPGPPAAISDEQLAVHKVVPGSFVPLEQTIEFGSVGHPIGEKPDPDRSVNQDHQAAVFVLRVSCRRRGTSFACASEPLSLRNRSYAACRIRASRPRFTVSVSVAAPQAFFASRSVA